MPVLIRDRGNTGMTRPHNILVIRNDKLGDFMLAWPVFALLKKQYPECRLTVLVPEYTRPIAEQCSWIDQVIIDKRHQSIFKDVKYLTALIRREHFDASISLFSEARTAMALWLAGVPYRLAPATKLAQIFYTHRLAQRRSRSEKPEYEYNLDLMKHYIRYNGDLPVAVPPAPYLVHDTEQINQIRMNYRKTHKIKDNTKLIIIHPGSGGSAVNLTLQQYAELASLIYKQVDAHFIITAGPNELEFAACLSKLLKDVPHSIYHSVNGLHEFSKFINICDMFIGGSTGPLHIAGALNIPTTAFYPFKRSATALRWQTINEIGNRLAFMPKEHTDDNIMQTIKINECYQIIVDSLINH